jgi:hypothetical protein
VTTEAACVQDLASSTSTDINVSSGSSGLAGNQSVGRQHNSGGVAPFQTAQSEWIVSMDEPALSFQRVTLWDWRSSSTRRCGIMRDKSLIPAIFHSDFTYRGSLGPSLIGHDQFAGHVDRVTAAFGNYTPDIGQDVWWTGMPIFTFDGSATFTA